MQDDPAHDPTDPPADGIANGPAAVRGAIPDSQVCPFLRSVGVDDALVDPIGTPDPANRCAAMRQAVPQSKRQQELVCLTSAHVSCPRYLRGTPAPTLAPSSIVASRLAVPTPTSVGEPTTRALTPATAAALLVFAAAFMLSLAFVVTNGGLEIAAAPPSPSASSPAIGAVPSPAPSSPRGSGAIVVAPPPSGPSTSRTPQPDPSAGASPAGPSASAAAPTPKPSSDRYALLKPCPGKSGCWIYTIRSGDNLFSIAHYYGIPLATVKRLNPWTRTMGLRAGQQLRLPPPTR